MQPSINANRAVVKAGHGSEGCVLEDGLAAGLVLLRHASKVAGVHHTGHALLHRPLRGSWWSGGSWSPERQLYHQHSLHSLVWALADPSDADWTIRPLGVRPGGRWACTGCLLCCSGADADAHAWDMACRHVHAAGRSQVLGYLRSHRHLLIYPLDCVQLLPPGFLDRCASYNTLQAYRCLQVLCGFCHCLILRCASARHTPATRGTPRK